MRMTELTNVGYIDREMSFVHAGWEDTDEELEHRFQWLRAQRHPLPSELAAGGDGHVSGESSTESELSASEDEGVGPEGIGPEAGNGGLEGIGPEVEDEGPEGVGPEVGGERAYG